MAGFQSFEEVREAASSGFLALGDKESTDAIFLLRNINEIPTGNMHYIKSSTYSGYVFCTGQGCPACAHKPAITVQQRCFLPLYNLKTKEVELFDRSYRWVSQNFAPLFKSYPDLTEFVIRITRIGTGLDTRYTLQAVGRNQSYTLADILKANNITSLSDLYGTKCKSLSNQEIYDLLNPSIDSSVTEGNTGFSTGLIQPREAYQFNDAQPTPSVDLPDYTPSKDELPSMDEDTSKDTETAAEDENIDF